MKKTNLFRYLLCGAILLSGLSCSDDENTYDPNNVDDPEKLTEPCPTTDELEVTHDQTLYHLSTWNTGESSIAENMVNRYQQTVLYTADELNGMQTGDAFLFSSNDIARIESDNELLTAMKRMVDEKGIVMMMEGGTLDDYARITDLLGVFNHYGESSNNSNTDTATDAVPLWIFSGELPGAKGLFAQLTSAARTATDEEGTLEATPSSYIDEHGQGVKCDMVSRSIQEALQPRAPAGNSKSLVDLINAYIVINQGDYAFPPVEDRTSKDYYQFEVRIWNVYSKDQNRQYYLVNLAYNVNAQHHFWGEWHSRGDKAYGICLTELQLNFNIEDGEGFILHEHSPKTAENEVSYTSGVSLDLGGDISLDGPSLSGGINISNSHTINIKDVSVKNLCEPIPDEPKVIWEFLLREPTAKFNMFCYGSAEVIKGAEAGISNFSGSVDFILSCPHDQPKSPRFWLYVQGLSKFYWFSRVFGVNKDRIQKLDLGDGAMLAYFPRVIPTE